MSRNDERLIIRSRRVVLPDGVRPARIVIEGRRIREVISGRDSREGSAIAGELDLDDLVVMPGLVDTHVHVNEPGRTDWEGFETASRAALAGGVTTIVDMPLNSVPATTTVAALAEKRAAAKAHARGIDVHFWGGVVPGNESELPGLAEHGVRGFKCFLVPSGAPEFEYVDEDDLVKAMPILTKLGLPLLVHAEVPGPIEVATRILGDLPAPTAYADYARTRPASAEVAAIALLIDLCREFGTRLHFVHLAASVAVPLIAAARREGLPITCETCPHYLYFAADEIPAGSAAHKCAPPIRNAANRDGLWDGLRSGTIDMIVTDHSPAPPAMKDDGSGDLLRAWGGIASLQLGLSAVWTQAAARDVPIESLSRWMSAAPAALAGLGSRKGQIAPGADADLAVFDPSAEFIVDPGALHHRHPITAYAGERLTGVVTHTFGGGRLLYERGTFMPPATVGATVG